MLAPVIETNASTNAMAMSIQIIVWHMPWSHTTLEKEPATATTLHDSFLLHICVTVSGWAELTDSYFYTKRKKRWAKMWVRQARK